MQCIKLSIFAIVLSFLTLGQLGCKAKQEVNENEGKPVVQVFYKEQPPSLQTLEKVKELLEPYAETYNLQYLLMTKDENAKLMESYGFPKDHFPFGIAIDGKTSAVINDELVVFAKFPDFMHHLGKHPGNWSLSLLQMVLDDNALLRDENPEVETVAGGKE